MTQATLLKGRAIADELQSSMRDEVASLIDLHGCTPKIVALSVGEDDASELYLRNQKRVAESIGILHEVIAYPHDILEDDFLNEIGKINQDTHIHGVIIQMPLPAHFNINKVYAVLNPLKDVEGIHADNLGLLVLKKGKLAPCTALSALALIEHTGVDLYGAEVVIVGAGKVVGRPLSLLLMEKMATVTVCNLGTSERGHLESHVRRADVLVVAAGKAGLIPGEWVKEGSIVIDVGINRVNGKVVGDVEFEAASENAAYITPVPGGVGPLTVTILMKNVLTAFRLQCEKQ